MGEICFGGIYHILFGNEKRRSEERSSLQKSKNTILKEETTQAWCRWLVNTLMMEGGEPMEKQHINFTFENPNRDEVLERVLQQILIDTLAAQEREQSAAA